MKLSTTEDTEDTEVKTYMRSGLILCVLSVLRGGELNYAQPPAHLTFSEHVAPVIFRHCAECHRPEGSAPFSLLTYGDVKRRAMQIVSVTGNRVMPPWKPEPGHGEFAGDRRLNDDQIALLRQWVDQGAAEGDRSLQPAPPEWSGSWRLGQPDLVLQAPLYKLRAGGDDMYRNFVIPIRIAVRRHIKAWEFLPGNPRVVHHATMQFDASGRSRRLDEDDPEPGYEGLIAHTVRAPDGYFLDWGPGHTPYVAPEGMAWPLEPNTDLVMMVHLRPSGKEELVQASVGLYFSELPPSRVPTLVRLTRQHLDIPAGEKRYAVTDSYTLDTGVDVYTVQPHAHYLATEVKSFATLPDGTTRPLIYIKKWDFNWQGVYRYASPVSLPGGTTVTMQWLYDNSAENPLNPANPPRRVTYGQRTSDEMSELWLQVVARNPADRAKFTRGLAVKVLGEEIVGHEKMLEADPANTRLHDDAALMYVEAGNLERATAHFAESLRLNPGSPAAHYNVGMALLMQGEREAARDNFARAVAIKPDYALGLTELAWILATSSDVRLRQPGEALRLAERASQLTRPPTSRVLEVQAAALASLGEYDRAVTASEAALRLAGSDQAGAARIRAALALYRQRKLAPE